jgi:glycosyltransferase involved in cell wall biosynthesis
MSISVVVATFGDEKWQRLAQTRAIPSTAGQSFDEVIAVHLPHGTLAEARNEGAERAGGDWLLFLDADDELGPDFAEHMLAAVGAAAPADPPPLFTPAACYARRSIRPAPRIWQRMDFKTGNWCVIGTLISRQLFHVLGGFREYGLYEDYALWALADRAGAEVVEVPEAVYVAHFQPKSRNRQGDKQRRLYWHQAIGHDVWPDHYDATTPDEDEKERLGTLHLRLL